MELVPEGEELPQAVRAVVASMAARAAFTVGENAMDASIWVRGDQAKRTLTLI
jgi:hypothetical protein